MLPYYPALRAKPGEFAACGRLAPRYQGYVCPRFVVPPPTESDPEKGRVPTLDEIAHIMGERLGKSWPHRRAFLDPQLAAAALGEASEEYRGALDAAEAAAAGGDGGEGGAEAEEERHPLLC